jgi:aryl-alcohol dehydrogenase-like predicted oxidoreductase
MAEGELGARPAQFALAWLIVRPGMTPAIASAIVSLDAASALEPAYS